MRSSHRSSMSRHRSSMSSHRSSFSRSRHSSITSRNGFGGIRHNSMHRSSIGSRHRSSLGGMHHSGLSNMHRSSFSRKSSIGTMGTMMSRRRAFKHHGISDAHAFNVGKATGVNINSSAMGAHGAALHRSKIRRSSRYTRKSGFSKSNYGMKRKIKFSSSNNKYKSRRYKYNPIRNNIDINIPFNNYSKYMGIFVVIFMFIFVIIMISMMSSFSHRMFFR